MASEASRALYDYVRCSESVLLWPTHFADPVRGDGREAFLNIADNESPFEWPSKCEIWHLLIVLELFTYGKCLDGVILKH
jgi:hypothetical protein